MEEYNLQPVTWSQFNREPLPGRNFTFWEWFYAVLKLTKDWLQGPWKARLIIGFISKQKSQEWLMMKPNGTFLLRFSDSEVGGITIAWVADDQNKPGERHSERGEKLYRGKSTKHTNIRDTQTHHLCLFTFST